MCEVEIIGSYWSCEEELVYEVRILSTYLPSVATVQGFMTGVVIDRRLSTSSSTGIVTFYKYHWLTEKMWHIFVA